MQHFKLRSVAKAVTGAAITLFAAASIAQTTTSSIRGKVLDASGAPVTNTEVTVVDQRTGATRRVSTNNSGTFFASNLSVGGPFIVTANDQTVQVDNISLGDVYSLTIQANTDSDPGLEEVVVTGKAVNIADVASGPSAVFSLTDLEDAVAFDRDIKDVFSADPRINLDDSTRGSGVNCGGKNPRFNGITVDGVNQADRFGLNNNGFATANGQPFPFDAIAQVSVELAPFDVTYGDFSACAINAVTKSGSNDFFGGLFYEYSNEDLRGDSIRVNGETIDVPSEDFTEDRLGFNLGGPILRDKLFFFMSYEEQDSPRFTSQGFDGSGSGVERDWLSEADFNRIARIARDVYNYEPGTQPGNGSNDIEKLLGRIDWDINESHRASLIYNKFEGVELRSSDGDLNEFEFSNHFYNKGSDLTTTIFKLNSQWTDNFSSELFLSRNELDDLQQTVGDPDFGDFQISIGRNTVYLGADDSRQANDLNYTSDLIKLNLQYLIGDHVITGGFEQDKTDFFNLFVQHSNGGEYDFFDDASRGGTLSGIDRFELGLPSRVYYGSGGGTNNANDAAANYTLTKRTVFIQDEYFFGDLDLTVVGGLRYERFESDDRPVFNQAFTDLTGIRNDANIDGLDLLMPRVGFTWNKTDELTLRGGLGVFSGGNPNVWISNSYSNDGITNVQLPSQSFDQSIFDLPLSGAGRPGFDVPQTLVDQVAARTADDAATSRLVIVDPNFKQPNELKLAFGATFEASDNLSIDADLLYTRQRDSAVYVDLAQEVTGRTAAGSPILSAVRGRDNFMLTNSDADADALVLSLSATYDLDESSEFFVGYAYSDVEDVAGMNSAVAFSNFANVATSNPNAVEAGTSEFEVPHRLTARYKFQRNFFGDLATRFSVLGIFKDGQSTSYTMSNDGLESNNRGRRQLLYVPNINDGAVVFADGFDQAGFNEFIEANGLTRGSFVGRNTARSESSARVDLRIDQELPEFRGVRPRLFAKFRNVLNMLNDNWGEQYDARFVSAQVVDSSVNDQGQFVFESFDPDNVTNLIENTSVWDARIGIELNF